MEQMKGPREVLDSYLRNLSKEVAAVVVTMLEELRQKGCNDEELCRALKLQYNTTPNPSQKPAVSRSDPVQSKTPPVPKPDPQTRSNLQSNGSNYPTLSKGSEPPAKPSTQSGRDSIKVVERGAQSPVQRDASASRTPAHPAVTKATSGTILGTGSAPREQVPQNDTQRNREPVQPDLAVSRSNAVDTRTRDLSKGNLVEVLARGRVSGSDGRRTGDNSSIRSDAFSKEGQAAKGQSSSIPTSGIPTSQSSTPQRGTSTSSMPRSNNAWSVSMSDVKASAPPNDSRTTSSAVPTPLTNATKKSDAMQGSTTKAAVPAVSGNKHTTPQKPSHNGFLPVSDGRSGTATPKNGSTVIIAQPRQPQQSQQPQQPQKPQRPQQLQQPQQPQQPQSNGSGAPSVPASRGLLEFEIDEDITYVTPFSNENTAYPPEATKKTTPPASTAHSVVIVEKPTLVQKGSTPQLPTPTPAPVTKQISADEKAPVQTATVKGSTVMSFTSSPVAAVATPALHMAPNSKFATTAPTVVSQSAGSDSRGASLGGQTQSTAQTVPVVRPVSVVPPPKGAQPANRNNWTQSGNIGASSVLPTTRNQDGNIVKPVASVGKTADATRPTGSNAPSSSSSTKSGEVRPALDTSVVRTTEQSKPDKQLAPQHTQQRILTQAASQSEPSNISETIKSQSVSSDGVDDMDIDSGGSTPMIMTTVVNVERPGGGPDLMDVDMPATRSDTVKALSFKAKEVGLGSSMIAKMDFDPSRAAVKLMDQAPNVIDLTGTAVQVVEVTSGVSLLEKLATRSGSKPNNAVSEVSKVGDVTLLKAKLHATAEAEGEKLITTQAIESREKSNERGTSIAQRLTESEAVRTSQRKSPTEVSETPTSVDAGMHRGRQALIDAGRPDAANTNVLGNTNTGDSSKVDRLIPQPPNVPSTSSSTATRSGETSKRPRTDDIYPDEMTSLLDEINQTKAKLKELEERFEQARERWKNSMKKKKEAQRGLDRQSSSASINLPAQRTETKPVEPSTAQNSQLALQHPPIQVSSPTSTISMQGGKPQQPKPAPVSADSGMTAKQLKIKQKQLAAVKGKSPGIDIAKARQAVLSDPEHLDYMWNEEILALGIVKLAQLRPTDAGLGALKQGKSSNTETLSSSRSDQPKRQRQDELDGDESYKKRKMEVVGGPPNLERKPARSPKATFQSTPTSIDAVDANGNTNKRQKTESGEKSNVDADAERKRKTALAMERLAAQAGSHAKRVNTPLGDKLSRTEQSIKLEKMPADQRGPNTPTSVGVSTATPKKDILPVVEKPSVPVIIEKKAELAVESSMIARAPASISMDVKQVDGQEQISTDSQALKEAGSKPSTVSGNGISILARVPTAGSATTPLKSNSAAAGPPKPSSVASVPKPTGSTSGTKSSPVLPSATKASAHPSLPTSASSSLHVKPSTTAIPRLPASDLPPSKPDSVPNQRVPDQHVNLTTQEREAKENGKPNPIPIDANSKPSTNVGAAAASSSSGGSSNDPADLLKQLRAQVDASRHPQQGKKPAAKRADTDMEEGEIVDSGHGPEVHRTHVEPTALKRRNTEPLVYASKDSPSRSGGVTSVRGRQSPAQIEPKPTTSSSAASSLIRVNSAGSGGSGAFGSHSLGLPNAFMDPQVYQRAQMFQALATGSPLTVPPTPAPPPPPPLNVNLNDQYRWLSMLNVPSRDPAVPNPPNALTPSNTQLNNLFTTLAQQQPYFGGHPAHPPFDPSKYWNPPPPQPPAFMPPVPSNSFLAAAAAAVAAQGNTWPAMGWQGGGPVAAPQNPPPDSDTMVKLVQGMLMMNQGMGK